MKINRVILQFASLILLVPPTFIFGQGALTPPGTPAPTMKSLDQIEARTPISSLPFTISSPGSYYLTKSLNVTTGNGITINASQVTVDLNGFTISSTASSATGTGIALASGLADITIFNGHIKGGVTYSGGTYSGPGFANGIEYSGAAPSNVHVSGISVSGCQFDGILLNTGSVVDSCTVFTVGGDGILGGSVFRSMAYPCGNVGIAGHTASDCYALTTGSGEAFSVGTAQNCYGNSSTGIGVSAVTAINCQGLSSGGNGSGAGVSAETALNCYGYAFGSGIGLQTFTATNCLGYATSGTGLSAIVIAIGSYGNSSNGTGLTAFIANSCYGESGTTGGISEVITHPYNMP